jgi:transposase InsO family protein
MTIYGSILPGAVRIARWAQKTGELTAKAKFRIKVLDWHVQHRNNVSLTARHFGLTRTTVRSWVRKFKSQGIVGLKDKSHRPKNLRRPTTSMETVIKIVDLRKQFPAWSKYKLQKILKEKGISVSVSTVGRILKRRGLINERISRKRRKAATNPKARFPKGMRIMRPGDMVQVDTKHVNIIEGKKHYQFTAIDVLTKRRTLKYYPTNSSRNGADFLKHCLEKFPFKVQAIQTDNGADFLKEFDLFCKKRRLTHYYTYSRSPKQNSYVEISHGADEREFYQQGNIHHDIEVMQKRLSEWEYVWNYVRPHAALDYLTPNQYFEKLKCRNLKERNSIILQA